MENNALNALIAATPRLWRGQEPNHSQRTLSTGHKRLDNHLPGGGWPVGAVSELITHQPGLGELSLLFPALSEISRQGQWLIFIDPPWIPYPAALHGRGLALERLLMVRSSNPKESLWACEQALRGSQGGVVLAWPQQASFARLRRLQLAAESGSRLAFLFHPEAALTSDSPAALRLHLRGDEHGTRIDILKCRGKRPNEPVWLPHQHLPGQSHTNTALTEHQVEHQTLGRSLPPKNETANLRSLN
jgi:hypothetical protein